jgi:hypothetical protein
MGKRELILVLGFVLAGALVYHLTAPASVPGDREFSVGEVLDVARRHVRGNRANAEVVTTEAYPLSTETNEARLAFTAESLTVIGEDRGDIAAELTVRSNGYDDQEAERLARATSLKVLEAGGRMEFKIQKPEPGSQWANVTLRVPSRIRIAMGRNTGKVTISNTADVEVTDSRGIVAVQDVPGRVTMTQRGGELNVADVGAVKLTLRGVDARIARVRREVTIQANDGELTTSELAGPIDVESNGTELRLDKLEATTAPVRVNATNGSLRMNGVASETRVDARNAEVVIGIARRAKLSVYAEGNESMEVTLPTGGIELDVATTAGGRISIPDTLAAVSTTGSEQRAAGRVLGGGPAVTLRATEGEITVRAADSPETPAPAKPPTPPTPPRPPELPPKLERR